MCYFLELSCIKDPSSTRVKWTPVKSTPITSTQVTSTPATSTPVKFTPTNQPLSVNLISSTPSSSKCYDFEDTSVFLNDDDSSMDFLNDDDLSMEFLNDDDVNDGEDCGSDLFMSSTSVEVKLIILKLFM